ncbi:putative Acid phosphatase [Helianthus debilis subsp. tardiflorus]
MGFLKWFLLAVLCVLAVDDGGLLLLSNGGVTSSFVRNEEKSIDMPFDSDVFRVPSGYNAPQQVHITQGDHVGKAVIVSWVTVNEPGSSTVLYWPQDGTQKDQATGQITTYKYYNYTSGYIHHCTLHNLEVNIQPSITYVMY